MKRAEVESVLAGHVSRLGDVEAELITLIAGRLEHGQRMYGPFVTNDQRREWIHEALEELLDGCVYLAVKVLGLRRRLHDQ